MRSLIAGFGPAREAPPVRRLALASRLLEGREVLAAHAGRCRRFLIFDLTAGPDAPPQVLNLAPAQSLFQLQAGVAHPLDGVDVLLAASIGVGVRDKLAGRGIRALVSARAAAHDIVRQWREGTLVTTTAEAVPAGRRGEACRAGGGDARA